MSILLLTFNISSLSFTEPNVSDEEFTTHDYDFGYHITFSSQIINLIKTTPISKIVFLIIEEMMIIKIITATTLNAFTDFGCRYKIVLQ